MTRTDRNILLSTFCVGFVIGVYVYFNGFSFKLSEDLPEEKFYTDFTIEGEAYGDCVNNECFAFQLLADGSYRLVDDVSGQSVIREGVINNSIRDRLFEDLDTESLKTQSISTVGTHCASDDGKVDYKFTITKDEKEYKLDTCTTNINFEGKAWLALSELWDYFVNL